MTSVQSRKIEDCTALILAGGESKRMGRDKAGVELNGQTLLQHVTAAMGRIFPEVVVSVRQPRAETALPQVCDDPAHTGPLAGLVAGLERADTPWLFAVACDMPFVTPALIASLADHRAGHQAVVPMVGGHPQPLAAFYAKDALDELHALLRDANARHSLRALLGRLNVCYVDEDALLAADPQLNSFFDLDTPEDLARAMKQG